MVKEVQILRSGAASRTHRTPDLEYEMPAGTPPEEAHRPGVVNASDHMNIAEWTVANSDWESILYTSGAILFRGFSISGPEAFDAALDSLMKPTKEFAEETSPRTSTTDRIYTSTDYPKQYPIQLHHEFSYRKSYPGRLAFCCLRPAPVGGATPLADSREVLARIPREIVTRFEERGGVTYVRNFTGLGVSWQDAFGTADKETVSHYCQKHDIECTWSGDDLHTRQTAPAVIAHPVTAERVWFNSVLNLNIAGVEPAPVREAMQSLPARSLPTNTLYGSGEHIGPHVVELIRQAYAAAAIRFTWQAGDLLLIDNVLTAHGRDPFEGERRVVVAMGDALARAVDR